MVENYTQQETNVNARMEQFRREAEQSRLARLARGSHQNGNGSKRTFSWLGLLTQHSADTDIPTQHTPSISARLPLTEEC
jgi:hypothetical protein